MQKDDIAGHPPLSRSGDEEQYNEGRTKEEEEESEEYK